MPSYQFYKLMNHTKIAIVIPCLNEADNIPELYRMLGRELTGYAFMCVFVDDGSALTTRRKWQSLLERKHDGTSTGNDCCHRWKLWQSCNQLKEVVRNFKQTCSYEQVKRTYSNTEGEAQSELYVPKLGKVVGTAVSETFKASHSIVTETKVTDYKQTYSYTHRVYCPTIGKCDDRRRIHTQPARNLPAIKDSVK